MRKTAKYDYSPLLTTAVYTGLRLGELIGLRWGDLDLAESLLHVRNQCGRDGKVSPPKTPKAIRRVPLASDLVQYLREHRLRSPHSTEGDFVFASARGTPLNHRNATRRGFEEARALADLPTTITFHDLRHAFASIMIERGVSPTVLAHVMGHRDARTTERIYIHLFNRERTDGQVREAMQSAMRL